MAKQFYIIDGYAQIFRAYYAIRGGMLSPVTSEPTHVVFGFTGMLLKLFENYQPDYVAVALDAPGKTFRDELFDEYKANREAMPEDLKAQIPRVLDLLDRFGIPRIGCPGFEADDVIATIVDRLANDPAYEDVHIRIVSKDKDLEQLLSERVEMFDVHKDTSLDVAGLQESKGIRPEQVVDVLALMGDQADNVPGVMGIGPKTAAKLVQEFGSIEGILANLEQIKGKRRENLEAARDQLELARELVQLRRDAPIDFSLADAQAGRVELQALLQLFQELGFNRYQREVRRLFGDGADAEAAAETGGSAPPEAAGAAARSGTAETAAAAEPALEPTAVPAGEYRAVTTIEELKALVVTLREQEIVSIDTETTGLGTDAQLCGISLAWRPGEAVYVPVRSQNPAEHLDLATVVAVLGPVLSDPQVAKCGHNVKFDAGVLLRSGIRLRGVAFDSMLAGQLLDPSQSSHKLDHMVERLLGVAMTPITQLIGAGDDEIAMDQVPLAEIVHYAAEDADMTLRLYGALAPTLANSGMDRLMREVEAPLAVVLAEMEHCGIVCDPDELARQGEALSARVEELRAEVQRLAGHEFHLDSPQQLAEVLFDRLGLKVVKKTKTGRSTDIEVLTKLASEEDPADPRTLVPGLIIEYRRLTKLINTYLGNLRDAVNEKTQRIHTTFHQLVTATGRLASQGPNLQNIPVRSDVGRQVRKAFKAPEGHVLICADYSQIELRILAHLSEDQGLIEAFEQDLDIHTAVASQVFNTPPEDVTSEQRVHAKTINFGIIYGVTPYGLARRIAGLDVSGAARLIADYKERFPGIETFLQRCVQQALEEGWVSTLLGRRRAVPEIQSSNRNRRSLGERLAINSVVQGSAADLIKVAMVNVGERLAREELPTKLLLQIHDELIFETPAEYAEDHAELVRDEMERAMQLRVPLKAEAGIGTDWMEAK